VHLGRQALAQGITIVVAVVAVPVALAVVVDVAQQAAVTADNQVSTA